VNLLMAYPKLPDYVTEKARKILLGVTTSAVGVSLLPSRINRI
jgi:hypothetical protein